MATLALPVQVRFHEASSGKARNRIMNSHLLQVFLTAYALMFPIASAYSQQATNRHSLSESEISVLRDLPDWKFTTKAYQEEALRIMVQEANRVAAQLPLREKLPITKNNLLEYHVGPPGLVRLGFIATTNYHYIFERKLSALVQTDIVCAKRSLVSLAG